MLIFRVTYAKYTVFVSAPRKNAANTWAQNYFGIGYGCYQVKKVCEAESELGKSYAKTYKIHPHKKPYPQHIHDKQCKNIVTRSMLAYDDKGKLLPDKGFENKTEECGHYIPDEFELCDHCIKMKYQLQEHYGGGCGCCGFYHYEIDDTIRAIREAECTNPKN